MLNVFEGIGAPVMAKFHPYKPHLFVADVDVSERHSLAVWGIRRAERVQRICLDGMHVSEPMDLPVERISTFLAQQAKQKRLLDRNFT